MNYFTERLPAWYHKVKFSKLFKYDVKIGCLYWNFQHEDNPLSFFLHKLKEQIIPNRMVTFVFLSDNLVIKMCKVLFFSLFFIFGRLYIRWKCYLKISQIYIFSASYTENFVSDICSEKLIFLSFYFFLFFRDFYNTTQKSKDSQSD